MGMNPWAEEDLAIFVLLRKCLLSIPASGVPCWQRCPVHSGGWDKEEDCTGCTG